MFRIQYGIRLHDVRYEDWTFEVPVRSLDHAEEVVNWHNDPKNESCYEASVVERQTFVSNWVQHPTTARNVAV